jgi:hypothetical protein
MAKLTQGPIRHDVPVKTGQRFKDRVSPGGVSEIGSAIGSTVKPGSLGNSYGGTSAAQRVMDGKVKHPTPMGNAVAYGTKCGPGGSRNIYKSGYQALHGTPVQGPSRPERDILSEFGPDLRGKGSKR